ncbi:hypothetical protein FACUT_9036 [Fusarium acutatum]|uniref:Uncharacterized protein n=1 Tax=Fusarium acutatum TaxID=78861 RepID=A0A8H4NFI0_9HYPO|nr:hypothetical protein FACUT_9036 [Fusarium acutatum]
MSSPPSSSKEAMAINPRPPPEPPEELKRNLQGSKVIFFTLDTLFDRNLAIECALKKCRQLNQDLRSKSMDELKRGYRDAMVAAYRQHIHTQLHGLGPGSSHRNSNPQVDKVGMIFQQLNLNPPSVIERQLIGGEFAAEFSRNRFEVPGASHCLGQLKHLEYVIVVADDTLQWDVVKDLNFWQYIDASIISKDLLVRKPDPRVFQKALDACGVSPKNAVIVGCSIEDDIVGIIAAGAEPILYMPGHDYTVMDVQGTRVLVVRTMAELLSEIRRRPENSHLIPAQQQQLPPVPSYPSHPPMVYAPQNQGYSGDQNDGPSSQSQHPASDPKPVEDRHASQSWERTRLSPILSQPGSSDETPRSHRLPDGYHSTVYYERNVRPAPPLSRAPSKRPFYESRSEHGYLTPSPVVTHRHDQRYPYFDPARGNYDPAGRPSPGPSTQSYWPRAPQPAMQLRRPNGDGSIRFNPTSSQPAYSPRSPSPPPSLPPISLYPLTEDYGISRLTYVENREQPGSWQEGHGQGTLRNRYHTQGGYQPPSRPPRSPYQPPIPNHASYQDQARSSGEGNVYETSATRYTSRGGYPPGAPIQYQASSPHDASHQDQQRSRHSERDYEVPGRIYSTRDQHQAGTPSPYEVQHEPREGTMSQQIEPSSDMYNEHGRHTLARRSASMSEANAHGPWETPNARHLNERWEPPSQRQPPCQDERRVQPYRREVINLTSDRPVHRLSNGDSNSTSPERWSTLHPQAEEQQEAITSKQEHSSSTNGETTGSAAHGDRRDEGPMADTVSSNVRPTSQSSSS